VVCTTPSTSTQRICEQILPQEVAMAELLRNHLPSLTENFLDRKADPDVTAKR